MTSHRTAAGYETRSNRYISAERLVNGFGFRSFGDLIRTGDEDWVDRVLDKLDNQATGKKTVVAWNWTRAPRVEKERKAALKLAKKLAYDFLRWGTPDLKLSGMCLRKTSPAIPMDVAVAEFLGRRLTPLQLRAKQDADWSPPQQGEGPFFLSIRPPRPASAFPSANWTDNPTLPAQHQLRDMGAPNVFRMRDSCYHGSGRWYCLTHKCHMPTPKDFIVHIGRSRGGMHKMTWMCDECDATAGREESCQAPEFATEDDQVTR